jgi:HAD superfamily hydrolase (TIGR01509 family)
MIVLFDFDGVVMDTEPQYTAFWDKRGMEYFGVEDFAAVIKGQTLVQIFDKHFKGREEDQKVLTAMVDDLERNMVYDYLPGVYEFMLSLKEAGIPSAIVTSSNKVKMAQVYQAHPELLELVDAVLTSEDFSKSKPDPECFLKGMQVLGGKPQETVVFEDSFHGIAAGRASGAFVVGLATTNTREAIAPLCDMVIDDFTGFTLDSIR